MYTRHGRHSDAVLEVNIAQPRGVERRDGDIGEPDMRKFGVEDEDMT